VYTHALQTVDMFRAHLLHHVYITAILTSSTAGLFHSELLQQCLIDEVRLTTRVYGTMRIYIPFGVPSSVRTLGCCTLGWPDCPICTQEA